MVAPSLTERCLVHGAPFQRNLHNSIPSFMRQYLSFQVCVSTNKADSSPDSYSGGRISTKFLIVFEAGTSEFLSRDKWSCRCVLCWFYGGRYSRHFEVTKWIALWDEISTSRCTGDIDHDGFNLKHLRFARFAALFLTFAVVYRVLQCCAPLFLASHRPQLRFWLISSVLFI